MALDPTDVARYLAERLDAAVTVESVTRTYPGMSRLTYLVRATVGGEPRGLVVRCDPPGGGIVPLPLRREFDVYERLHGSAVPVARPLWFDESPWLTGGLALMVREMVEGSAAVPGLADPGPEGDAIRRGVAFAQAEMLATLHTLDWRAMGFGDILDDPGSPAQSATAEVDLWWDIAQRMHVEADPQLRRIMHWIRSEAPTDAPPVSLLKGNNGIDEELWRDGRIVAMVDFELAALGDPASDWAFSQGILTLIDPDETLAAYERAAGFAIPRRNLAWYQVWTLVKVVVTGRCGLAGFVDGRDPRPSLAAFGLGMGTRCAHIAAQLVGMDVEVAAAMLTGRVLKKED